MVEFKTDSPDSCASSASIGGRTCAARVQIFRSSYRSALPCEIHEAAENPCPVSVEHQWLPEPFTTFFLLFFFLSFRPSSVGSILLVSIRSFGQPPRAVYRSFSRGRPRRAHSLSSGLDPRILFSRSVDRSRFTSSARLSLPPVYLPTDEHPLSRVAQCTWPQPHRFTIVEFSPTATSMDRICEPRELLSKDYERNK